MPAAALAYAEHAPRLAGALRAPQARELGEAALLGRVNAAAFTRALLLRAREVAARGAGGGDVTGGLAAAASASSSSSYSSSSLPGAAPASPGRHVAEATGLQVASARHQAAGMDAGSGGCDALFDLDDADDAGGVRES